MLSSSSPGRRSRLEAQTRQVYDVTGKSLNEIRTDLEFTGNVQKTIDRIGNGEFLKDTPRDPSRKARLNGDPMAPKPRPPGPVRAENRRVEEQGRKGKGIASAIPPECEIINLCDSGDEAPTAVQSTRGPSRPRPAKVLSSAVTKSSLSESSSASLSSITKPYVGSAVISSKQGNIKPPAQRYKTPPLFRYSPSPTSPSPPLRESPMNKRPHSLTAPPRVESPTAAVPLSNKKQKTIHIISLDDESDLELLTHPPQPAAASSIAQGNSRLSATTRALLQEFAEYSEDSGSDSGKRRRSSETAPKKKKKGLTTGGRTGPPIKRKMKDVSVEVCDRDDDNSSTERPKKNNRLSEGEKARRAAEKEEIRLLKQQEREAKTAEKEETKTQKKREKEVKEAEKKREQELVSANRLKTSKKDSAPEMIVDISIDLAASVLGDQLRRFILAMGCEVNHEWQPVMVGDGLFKVVKWRRRVKAEYNEERGMFLPLPVEQVRDEQHLLVYLTAKEFLEISMGATDGLAEHVSRIKRMHPGRAEDIKLIYLIEGLDALARKNKSNRNRQYQNRVRAQLGTGEGSNSVTNTDIIDDDQIEDGRLRLQVVHGCLIHETNAAVESMEWISKFTGDISTIPYKKSRIVADTAFCTDVGQVKTGLGKADTYSRMLEEIHRVTPSVANGVASEYPDVQALVNAFRLHGESAVENLPNIATKDGLPMSRTIGTACSRRIYGIFMGTDPFNTDV